MQFTQEQKIAIVLMNLPPAETAEVLDELTQDEVLHFSQIYAGLPELEVGTCEWVMGEMLAS
jgi:flagellar motor switch protein FliG